MVFLVAEIGVNWEGDFKLLEKIVTNAKKIGFDSVKFQAFNEKNVQAHPLKERLLKSAISHKNIERVDELARSIGIEWFCTPMYPEAVPMLDNYVKRFKIRVFDGRTVMNGKPSDLVKKVLETQKETLISVEKTPNDDLVSENIKWLYCVPKYPCNLEDLNFSMIEKFDGYSNHCPNIIAPLTAAILGAKFIEVHVTANKNLDYADNAVSFDFEEQKKMVRLIRDSEKIRRMKTKMEN